ncbi:nuclear transport factor 2 family protein [Limibaculum sp. M0105]|uniref:Nuclear transport factor 2 family protein n=1 Tax=Thermohalobaculum xanthum TaxID=2753746 RepID=A0A8J7M7W3_9RHOB|nr:nuclear transport factor 2 family protein [Thermohalobaculum xanthum]MBK0399936.1 nuclear transport factor 2 family protein [Thermohalobaculum xanthum]
MTDANHAPPADPSADIAEILSLTDAYAAMLHRCDTEVLDRIFHPQAVYATAQGGELLHRDMPAYRAVLASRVSPEARGETGGFTLERIEFAGPDAAMLRLSGRMLGNAYTDLLSLLRIDGRWQIIAKVFHAAPAA